MDDAQVVLELNKVLTLEHGHLGMYLWLKDKIGESTPD